MSDTDTIARTVVLVMPDGSEYYCDVTSSAESKIARVQKAKKYGWGRAFLFILRHTKSHAFDHVRNAVKIKFEEAQ